MDACLLGFGLIEIEGHRYAHDVVIERGEVRKRRKGPSKPWRDHYGHTPLSAGEAIPWHGDQLIVGPGAEDGLPIMREVVEEAKRRGIKLIAVPTERACRMLADLPRNRVNAILHVTC